MMDHAEIESLLGAYALDAVSEEEAVAIDEHLPTCPRCSAEVAAHREVAALLGGSGADAPAALWDSIASELDGRTFRDADVLAQGAIVTRLPLARRAHIPRRPLAAALLVAAAFIAVLGIMDAQISRLNSEVHQQQAIAQRTGMASAVASLLAAPHSTITLDGPSPRSSATIAVSPHGQAYWLTSSLHQLDSARTYQLWALAKGRVVSIALLGADPRSYSAFRLEPGMTRVMVTVEPGGGSPAPTSPVLLSGAVAL